MQNDLSPDYLSALVPPTVGSTSAYQLRNAPNVMLVHANTHLYYNSFLPSVAWEWNGLPQDVRDLNSLGSFKNKLNANTKPTSYFNKGSLLRQIYHARLRTHCSSLNEHLFTKHIVDSPLCVWGEIENMRGDLRRDLLMPFPITANQLLTQYYLVTQSSVHPELKYFHCCPGLLN